MKRLKKIIFILVIMMTCIFCNSDIIIAEELLDCSVTLKSGSKNSNVKILQTELNIVANCGLKVDGDFGAKTATCVKTFQNANSLSQDGIVGSKTCKKLNEMYEKQITNNQIGAATDLVCSNDNILQIDSDNNVSQVKYLQKKLNETLECRLTVNGTFNEKTATCVKKFQKEFNLTVDGVAGPKTCKKLNEIYPKVVANKDNSALEKQGKEETLDCHAKLKQGSKGDNVELIQTQLNKVTSCNLKVDGDFGAKTTTCIKNFQQSQGLASDGIVGANTCNKLNTEYLSDNTYVISRFTSIRKKASNSSSEVAFAKYGTVFKVYDTTDDGEWHKIKYNDEFYYIANSEVDTTGVIVDISEQSLEFYENGKLKMDTIVITGNKSTNNTRTGKFVIEYKERGRYLNGVSYVDYWMKFDNGNGFHDADGWRSNSEFYDATRYDGNGSHGCVNMLDDDAKALYEATTALKTKESNGKVIKSSEGTLVIIKK